MRASRAVQPGGLACQQPPPAQGPAVRSSPQPRHSATLQRPPDRRRRRPPPCAAGGGGGDWTPLPPAPKSGWATVSADGSDGGETEDEQDLDLFPPEAQRDPEFVAENLLALVLIGLAALAAFNILLKLLIVAYALVAAGVRYTAVGIFLAVLLTQLQPGRWWF